MLNQAMTLKRSVVEKLRPSLLDHFGLAVAIRSHFEEHCRNAGIDCIATLPEDTLHLEPAAQLALFRIAQEVLSGIVSRGGAANVELLLEAGETGYTMLIGDDGPAMDTDLTRSMPSLPQRARLAGGVVEADARAPAEGGGNRVRIFVPRSAAVSA
jgi:signal transduction histidine kinase